MEYWSETNFKKAIGLGYMDHTWRAAFRGDHYVASIAPKARIDGFCKCYVAITVDGKWTLNGKWNPSPDKGHNC